MKKEMQRGTQAVRMGRADSHRSAAADVRGTLRAQPRILSSVSPKQRVAHIPGESRVARHARFLSATLVNVNNHINTLYRKYARFWAQ